MSSIHFTGGQLRAILATMLLGNDISDEDITDAVRVAAKIIRIAKNFEEDEES